MSFFLSSIFYALTSECFFMIESTQEPEGNPESTSAVGRVADYHFLNGEKMFLMGVS